MSSREERIHLNVHIHQSESRIDALNYRLSQIHKQLRIEKANLSQLNKKKKEIRRRYNHAVI